jgi:hypothetical protein
MTWFRGLPECQFVPLHEPFAPAEVAAQLAEKMNEAPPG